MDDGVGRPDDPATLDGYATGPEPSLAVDPFAPDAVPFDAGTAPGAELLPEWYMPVPQRSAADRTPRRVVTVGLIVAALLLVNGVGLCVTYGLPEIAW